MAYFLKCATLCKCTNPPEELLKWLEREAGWSVRELSVLRNKSVELFGISCMKFTDICESLFWLGYHLLEPIHSLLLTQ